MPDSSPETQSTCEVIMVYYQLLWLSMWLFIFIYINIYYVYMFSVFFFNYFSFVMQVEKQPPQFRGGRGYDAT